MKRSLTFIVFVLSLASAFAQPKGKPSMEEIKARKIAYITEMVQLTPEEAQNFWPLYNELQQKIAAQHKKRHDLSKFLSFLNQIRKILLSSQTVGKTGISILAIVALIPQSCRLSASPSPAGPMNIPSCSKTPPCASPSARPRSWRARISWPRALTSICRSTSPLASSTSPSPWSA